jgi:hypothetical protein
VFNYTLAGYRVSKHTLDQMLTRNIKPEHIESFILKNNIVRKFKMANGTTRLVLNKTKILELMDNIDRLMPSNDSSINQNEFVKRLKENKEILEILYQEGGITAVVNETAKVLITVY